MSGERKPEDETAAPAAAPAQDALSEADLAAPAPQNADDEAEASPENRAPSADLIDSDAAAESSAERYEAAPEPETGRDGDDWSRNPDPVETEATAYGAAADGAPSEARTGEADAAAPQPAQTPQPAQPEAKSGGFASKALAALVLLIAGAALAVWGGPKLAPMLPAGLAAYLTPANGGDALAALQADVAALNGALDGAGERADAALAAASGAGDRLAEIDATVAALGARIDAAAGGAGDPALAGRVGDVEAALTALRAELAALPTDAGSGGAAEGVSPAALAETRATLTARADAIAARIDAQAAEAASLAARIAALDPAVADMSGQVADVDARLAALEAGLEQTANAKKAATLALAMTTVERAMMTGAPFASALDQAAGAADTPPPDALSAAASTGAPTLEALAASFDDAAYAALNATVETKAADAGVLAGVLARVEARITGLPVSAIAGDDPQAVLSRARAAVEAGNFSAALDEIAALPPEAQAAMADWTAGARLRGEADAALAAWRAEVDAL